jgi:hypothetical protein
MRKLPQTNFDETLALIYEQRVLLKTLNEELDDPDGPENALLTRLEDGPVSLGEFKNLASKFLEINGISKEEIIELVADELGVDLDSQGDNVIMRGGAPMKDLELDQIGLINKPLDIDILKDDEAWHFLDIFHIDDENVIEDLYGVFPQLEEFPGEAEYYAKVVQVFAAKAFERANNHFDPHSYVDEIINAEELWRWISSSGLFPSPAGITANQFYEFENGTISISIKGYVSDEDTGNMGSYTIDDYRDEKLSLNDPSGYKDKESSWEDEDDDEDEGLKV